MTFTDREQLAIAKILTEVMNEEENWNTEELAFMTQLCYMIGFDFSFLSASRSLNLRIALAILEESEYNKQRFYGNIFSEMKR